MSKTISTVLQRIKTSVDNDSFMFVFKNASWSESYNRSILYTPWDVDSKENYYTKCILPRIISEGVVNIYYKNTNGIWIDYTKYINVFATQNVLVGSVINQNLVSIDKNKLPRTIFMDNDHMVYYIDSQDGDYTNSVNNIYIDEMNDSILTVQPYSLSDPTLPFSARHIMPDIKVRVKNVVNNTLLVWLCGVFVPIYRDEVEDDVFYIKNGMLLVNTFVKDQRIDAPTSNVSSGIVKTATIKEDESYNIYRYNFNIRLFKWKNVSMSDWASPISTLTSPIIHNYSAVYVQKTLIFNEPVNRDAHMIVENGIVIDPSEYTIDASDARKVTLLNVEQRAYNLLNEIIADIVANPNVYKTVKPLDLIESSLTEKTYSMINFTTTEAGKTLYIKHSKACAVDFPYRNEITFSKVNIGDLILIDGTFSPYEWIHKYTIKMPNKKYTFNSSTLRSNETQISRVFFVCK